MCLFIFTCDEMLKMELKCSPRLATEFFLDLFPLRGAGLQILMLLSVFLANFRVLGLGCGLLKVAKMKTFQYISRPIFFAISFSGKSQAFFVGGQDSISVIASQFYISSNKQKLLANIDQRDSKVLLLIVTSSMNRYPDSSVDKGQKIKFASKKKSCLQAATRMKIKYINKFPMI